VWSAGFWVVFFVPFSNEVLFICASPQIKNFKKKKGKEKRKKPHWCAGESLAGPQPSSLTWGCQRACQSSICCASEKGKKNSGKWVRITTGGKEVTGRCRAEGPALCSGPMVHRRPFYW